MPEITDSESIVILPLPGFNSDSPDALHLAESLGREAIHQKIFVSKRLRRASRHIPTDKKRQELVRIAGSCKKCTSTHQSVATCETSRDGRGNGGIATEEIERVKAILPIAHKHTVGVG